MFKNFKQKNCGVFREFGFWVLELFRVSDLGFRNSSKGVSLLLVVVILSALMSTSIGIFNVVFGQIKISGEISDSFYAFYAADQGLERTLYRDRMLEAVCQGIQGSNCFIEEKTIASRACFIVFVSKSEGNTNIISSGQYRCGDNPPRIVKRGFQVGY